MVTSKERFHDETTTGELGNASTSPKARVSYSTSYYDKANRTTASVNVGTNGGSSYTRLGTVPSRSDTVLVTDYGYNASGWLETTTDPKGFVGKQYYDHMGRTIKTIENYVDGTVGDDNDKTVEYTYDANGQMSTLKALLTSGYQETKWIYGITSPIVSNDVLLEMRYPDTSTGNASSSEKDSFTYNNLGEVLTKTDRNGNVHTFTRDILGRQTIDAVTTLGSGVDGSIRRVETNYDTQGNVYQITTYDAATSGSVVNQIQRGYNGLGQMTVEYQAVNGSVNTGSTPKVQYGYSEMASSANHSRLNTITYPNGRVLTYNYASGLNNNISRLTSISDGGTTLESYDYLGYGTVVSRKHAESGVDLTYMKLTGESDGAAGDKYIGLDLFGRIVDQRWTASTTTKDRFQYGYDRDSNRLYKENLVSSANSELYAYDNLNQLTSMERGTLNGGKTALNGAASRSQSWDFDALGNFDSQTTNGTAETRAHNKQNEITSISGATTPTYDANGNLTTDETGKTLKFDAWNRLAEVKNSGGTTIADFNWDGLGRRVQEIRSGTTTDLYYSSQWQVLEERVSGTARMSYAWSPVYVDAIIARDRDSDSNGSLEERVYVMQDANFNTTGLVNTSGTVVERYQLDAYGTPTFFDASFGSRGSSSYGFNYLHQGGRWDSVVGVYSFRHREMSPTLGRWVQNDPIGTAGEDMNLYRDRLNSPYVMLDWSGLTACDDFADDVVQIAAESESAYLPDILERKRAGSKIAAKYIDSKHRRIFTGIDPDDANIPRTFDGFCPQLIMGGQNRDVYKHLGFNIAARLQGLNFVSDTAETIDCQEVRISCGCDCKPSAKVIAPILAGCAILDKKSNLCLQDQAEVIGDILGRRAGRILADLINNKIAKATAKDRLKELLCGSDCGQTADHCC